MMDKMGELMLREFVRWRIPFYSPQVQAEAIAARRDLTARFEANIASLNARKQLPDKDPDFLREDRYRAQCRRLKRNFDRDFENVETDPDQPHFLRWHATETDWQKLLVRMLAEKNPGAFGIEQDTSRAGDDQWHFEIILDNYLRETPNVSEATRKAAEHIIAEIDSGDFIRQFPDAPRKPVTAENLRQIFYKRKAMRDRNRELHISDDFTAFHTWARSDQCSVSQAVVDAILPPENICCFWAEEERRAWAGFRAFCDRFNAVDSDNRMHGHLCRQFRDSLPEHERETLSAWGRFQSFADTLAGKLTDKGDREKLQADRRTLVNAFWQFRHEFNETLNSETMAIPPLRVRRVIHHADRYRAGEAAAAALSTPPELWGNGEIFATFSLQRESRK